MALILSRLLKQRMSLKRQIVKYQISVQWHFMVKKRKRKKKIKGRKKKKCHGEGTNWQKYPSFGPPNFVCIFICIIFSHLLPGLHRITILIFFTPTRMTRPEVRDFKHSCTELYSSQSIPIPIPIITMGTLSISQSS